MELDDYKYKKCSRDNFFMMVESSKFPADDRSGDIVSIYKRGWFSDKRIKSTIVTQGDEGEELRSIIKDTYKEVENYNRYQT